MLVASEILIVSLFGGLSLFCLIMGMMPLIIRVVRRLAEL